MDYDAYRAVYDAVAARIGHPDIGGAVSEVMRQANISFYFEGMRESFRETEYERQRPSVLFPVKLSLDGNQYCALYGEDLMQGVAGFGDTVEKAMRDFDNNWFKQKAPIQG